MRKKIVLQIILLITDMIRGVGSIMLASPFFLYWFIHGNDERYRWIISGPYPFNAFGGGPFQFWIFSLGLVGGALLICLSTVIKKSIIVKVERNPA
jgi:hypothetical protein